VETRVDGDPASCHALADYLRKGGYAARAAGDDIHQVRGTSESCWGGDAAEQFRTRMTEMGKGSNEIEEYSRQIAQATEVFADDLVTVRTRMAQARGVAAEAGLPLTGTVIGEPGAAPVPLPNGGAGATPEQVAAQTQAMSAHSAQVAAYTEVQTTVAEARQIENRAHQTLSTALGRQTSFLQSVQGSAGWIAWSTATGGAGALHGAAKKWAAVAARKGDTAARWAPLTSNQAFSTAFREGATTYANTVGMKAAEATRHADSAARALGNLGNTRFGRPLLDGLARTPAHHIRATTGPLAKIKPSAGRIPYVGALTTAAQVTVAGLQGKPVDEAAAAGMASFAAGSITTSAAATGLIAAGMAAGPAGWVAVGAGVAVSVGVGYVVENYGDDIADAAGDAWDSTLGKVF